MAIHFVDTFPYHPLLEFTMVLVAKITPLTMHCLIVLYFQPTNPPTDVPTNPVSCMISLNEVSTKK